MKRMLYVIFTVLYLFGMGLSSCKRQSKDSIGDLYWVEGQWKGRVKGGVKFENWRRGEDSTLIGHGCTISNGDTVFQETMKIVKKGGAVYYVVEVDDNDGPVSFKMVETGEKGTIFENPEHDYPTRIVYANTLGDMLLARIEGKRGDKPDTARFFMHRNAIFTER